MAHTACINLAHVCYVSIEGRTVYFTNGHSLEVHQAIAEAISDHMHRSYASHTCSFDRRRDPDITVDATCTNFEG